MSSIAVLLPTREKFSSQGAGALAINAHDFATGSRFHQQITVYGGAVETPYADVRFVPLHNRARFFKSPGHLKAFKRALNGQSPTIIEVWNRPIFHCNRAELVSERDIALQLGSDAQEMRAARTLKSAGNYFDWLAECTLARIGCARGSWKACIAACDSGRVVTLPLHRHSKTACHEGKWCCLLDGSSREGALLLLKRCACCFLRSPIASADRGWRQHGHLGDTPYACKVGQEFAPVGAQAAVSGYLPLPEVRTLMGRASIFAYRAMERAYWSSPLEGMAEGAPGCHHRPGWALRVVGDAG